MSAGERDRGLRQRRRTPAALTLVALAVSATLGVAQQTSLTESHIKSAAIEVPRLMELLELRTGMTVADVGAGFSAWTTAFARAIGESGHVFATEIGAPQLAALRENVAKQGLKNVTIIEGTPSATGLPPSCCDAILVRDAFHHFTAPAAMITSLAAALKPGGRLAIVDFPPQANSQVPSGVPANRNGHGIPAEVIQQEVATVLSHVRTILAWSPQSQPANTYIVIFRKPT
jgi:ubiquinone/menaquinone biosynthesis C-methylase UbiE